MSKDVQREVMDAFAKGFRTTKVPLRFANKEQGEKWLVVEME